MKAQSNFAKKAVDCNLPEAGTEYTAGPNITITNGEIDTKRVLELTDITIAGEVLAGKITANGVINGSLFFWLTNHSNHTFGQCYVDY